MNTLYWLESEVTTKACSFLNGRNTGLSNVNVVGVDAFVEIVTSSGCLTTLENGRISCVGIPFSTVRMSTTTGISLSFWKKNKSILERYTPPSKLESSIKKVCARGSCQRVSFLLEDVELTRVLLCFWSSDVTFAFLTD